MARRSCQRVRAESRRGQLGFDHVVAHGPVVGRDVEASHEGGAGQGAMDLAQRALHAAVAAHVGTGMRDFREQLLGDDDGLVLQVPTAARTPAGHLATFEKPDSVEGE